MNVKAGQVWKDNYVNSGGVTRFVKVVTPPANEDPKSPVTIQRCGQDGSAIPKSPTRTTEAKRFNGKKDGFTLHQDVAAEAPAPAGATDGAQPAAS